MSATGSLVMISKIENENKAAAVGILIQTLAKFNLSLMIFLVSIQMMHTVNYFITLINSLIIKKNSHRL